MQKVYIYLENGIFLEANSFGADTTAVGKLVYNNSTFGQQEIITDPSNNGLFINFTAVEIGNTGANRVDMESSKAYANGIIVRNYHDLYSNYRADMSLKEFLIEQNVIGICDIDTRYLTKTLREEGSMMMIASTKISSKDELAKELSKAKKYDEINFVKDSSTKEAYIHKSGVWNDEIQDYNKASMSDKKVLVIDYGVKKSFLNELVELGFEVEVVPASTKSQEIINNFKLGKIGGVVLSSGAGNPNILKDEVEEIKRLIEANIPIFGVGLGHYLLALANGGKVEKIKSIKYGSHPIKGDKTVEICSVNSDFEISEDIKNIANITHIKVFNDTAVALKYNNKNELSSEFTPTSNSTIYKEFTKMVK
ncbi:carbamoyl phosphate synthase small subunit [Aliarcobacter trophiarum LMG 25534]|nr:carbamoyl phosphate synthase small subunit [Aliarcobacter trophiarum]RXJ90037.1 carbamoyl phosphate synthase small subunit [Aliarcobacter trophiarum LMG 25534]